MILKKIILKNFRNFTHSTIYFHPFLTIILGPNSIGKTNLLESIYLLSCGKGFVDENQSELINFDKKNLQISAEYGQESETNIYTIVINHNKNLEKKFAVNRIRKNLNLYLKETTPTVFFTPPLIQIIDGRPGRRRKFFDEILSTLDPVYRRMLIDFETGLKKRNKILELERKDIRTLKDELAFWDEYLIKKADYICRSRQKVCDLINEHKSLEGEIFELIYLKNEMSSKTLEESFDKQLQLHTTPVGPQRDDFKILKNNINVHTFGSRSEQRMALFWLILNQINLYKNHLKIRPLLLLDDIFSELDVEHKKIVLTLIRKYQTILTTTESDLAHSISIPHAIINLNNKQK